MSLTLVRQGEARYEFQCALLAVDKKGGVYRLSLAHDETPRRIQLREFARVKARGRVELRMEDAVLLGSLRDVSVGGIAVRARTRIPVGTLVQTTFSCAKQEFRDLSASVCECRPRSMRTFLIRLEFRELSTSDEHRIAALVAQESVRPLRPPRN